MKFKYISDIHIFNHIDLKDLDNRSEQLTEKINEIFCYEGSNEDTLIIAGDLGSSAENNLPLLEQLSSMYKHVFFILGNHDFYGGSGTYDDKLSEYRKIEGLLDNVTILHNDIVEYEGLTIAGSTVWYKLSNPVDELSFMMMNDSRYIFKSDEMKLKYADDMEFLDSIKDKDIDILITHTPPITSKLSEYPFNACFINEEALIVKPKIWIAGHQHTVDEFTVDGIKYKYNPYGYPNENTMNEPKLRGFEIGGD